MVPPARILLALTVFGASVAAALAIAREKRPEKLECCMDEVYIGMPEYPAQITRGPACSDLLSMPETTRLEMEAKRDAIAQKLAGCGPEHPDAVTLRDASNRLALALGEKPAGG